MAKVEEAGSIPCFYADVILDVEVFPGSPNIKIIYAELKETAEGIVKVPVLVVIQPMPPAGECALHTVLRRKAADRSSRHVCALLN
jgi:hypothetical protein